MVNFKNLFHYISYLQYPCMLASLWFIIQPYMLLAEHKELFLDSLLSNANITLMLMGVGVSFSSLQDTSKTQNKLSLRIYQNPRKSKLFLILVIVLIFIFLIAGLIGFFSSSESAISELSIGSIVLAIGMMGMLKAVVEMAEHHKIE